MDIHNLLKETGKGKDAWMVRCILAARILSRRGQFDWILRLTKQQASDLIDSVGSSDTADIKIDNWGRPSVIGNTRLYKAVRRGRGLEELTQELSELGVEWDGRITTDGHVVFLLAKYYGVLPETWQNWGQP